MEITTDMLWEKSCPPCFILLLSFASAMTLEAYFAKLN